MIEKQLHKLERQQMKQPILEATEDNSLQNKRRRLLKGTVAIPVIMTLHSGAALARTSNLVGAIMDTNAAAKDGVDLICVHPGVNGSDTAQVPVDLGDGPFVTVNRQKAANEIDPDLDFQAGVCLGEEEMGRGILVSANTWNSIAPNFTNM